MAQCRGLPSIPSGTPGTWTLHWGYRACWDPAARLASQRSACKLHAGSRADRIPIYPLHPDTWNSAVEKKCYRCSIIWWILTWSSNSATISIGSAKSADRLAEAGWASVTCLAEPPVPILTVFLRLVLRRGPAVGWVRMLKGGSQGGRIGDR